MDTSEKDGREIESVALPSATVQAESTADGDAAVFIPHIQPQLNSPQLTNKSNASFIRASTIDIIIVLLTEAH